MNFRLPDQYELDILNRNGISSDGIAVLHSSNDSLVILVHKTRDTIMISAGERPWKKRSRKNANE